MNHPLIRRAMKINRNPIGANKIIIQYQWIALLASKYDRVSRYTLNIPEPPKDAASADNSSDIAIEATKASFISGSWLASYLRSPQSGRFRPVRSWHIASSVKASPDGWKAAVRRSSVRP